jgi:hypothetical protein
LHDLEAAPNQRRGLREVMVYRLSVQGVRESPTTVFSVAFAYEEQDLLIAKVARRLRTLAADDYARLLAGVGPKGVSAKAKHGNDGNLFEQPGPQVRPSLGTNLVVGEHDGQTSLWLEKLHAAFKEQDIAFHAVAGRKLIAIGVLTSHIPGKGRIGQHNIETHESRLLRAHEVFQNGSQPGSQLPLGAPQAIDPHESRRRLTTGGQHHTGNP